MRFDVTRSRLHCSAPAQCAIGKERISLAHFVIHQDNERMPFPECVNANDFEYAEFYDIDDAKGAQLNWSKAGWKLGCLICPRSAPMRRRRICPRFWSGCADASMPLAWYLRDEDVKSANRVWE